MLCIGLQVAAQPARPSPDADEDAIVAAGTDAIVEARAARRSDCT
jgi:hypothetical protein